MAGKTCEAEAIRSALLTGTASVSTVSALQSLLASETSTQIPPKNAAARTKPKVAKPASTRNLKPAAAKSKTAPPVAVHEDAPKPLSGREKYALATETVNASLKILTDSLKSGSAICNSVHSNDNAPKSPTSKGATPRVKRPLEPRSGNTTPVRSPPKKGNGVKTAAISPSRKSNTPASHVASVAECARLGFSFLGSVDMQAAGIREMPKLQLETGMLALVSKLIGHRLDSLAVRELRVLKRRLEELLGSQKKNAKPATKTSRVPAPTSPPEKDTMASLLSLNITMTSNLDALPLATTYYQHVLKLLSASKEPATINEAAEQLSIESLGGPVDVIIRQAKRSGELSKAAKQLESLSQTVLGLCPSVSSSADEEATDGKRSPSPRAVFKIQTFALRLRQMWWRMAKHEADVTKELLEPFQKCISAFSRRDDGTTGDKTMLELLEKSFESLGPLRGSGHALFGIHNVLCSQAERAGLLKKALKWADCMVEDCSDLKPRHAMYLAALVRRASIVGQGCSTGDGDGSLQAIIEGLESNLSGAGADYDLLLSSLTNSTRQIPRSAQTQRLAVLSASFAQQYARSYPGKNPQQLQTILEAALRSSKSTEDILGWVTVDSARVFIDAGTMKTVAEGAAAKPIADAWSWSTPALSLSRILRAITLKAVRSDNDSKAPLIFDDEKLESAERGAILEWQLKCLAELAPRTKYHPTLKKILPDLLRRLSKVYTAAEYPIRRARISTMAFLIRECNSELIPPHVFHIWREDLAIDGAKLSGDLSLEVYCRDVATGFAVTKLFSDGTPAIADLKPHLQVWHDIVHGSETWQALCNKIDDPTVLFQQLKSIAAYFCMLGEDEAGLSVLLLLAKFNGLYDRVSFAYCTSLVQLARQYLRLGYSEKAATHLSQAKTVLQKCQGFDLASLQYQVTCAEHLLAIDNVEQCHAILEEGRQVRTEVPPEKIPRDQRATYELLHAQGWLIQSQYLMEVGSPHEALTAATRAVKLLNSIWAVLERSNAAPKPKPQESTGEESTVNSLTKGVSKLHLSPKEEQDQPSSKPQQSKRGAAFWTVVPVLCKALLHLSDVYAHHGIFNEANYYSERAVNIAESVGSSVLLSRLRCHRSRFLTLAGQLENAELCLTQGEALASDRPSLAVVERLRARAAIRFEEGSLEETLVLNGKAKGVLEDLSSETRVADMEKFLCGDIGALEKDVEGLSLNDAGQPSKKPTTQRARAGTKAPPKTAPKQSRATAGAKAKTVARSEPATKRPETPYYMLAKLKTAIHFDEAILRLRLGREFDPASFSTAVISTSDSLRKRYVDFEGHMRQAGAMLEMDVTLNVLAESTLSFPAMMNLGRRLSKESQDANVPKTSATARKAPSKVNKGAAAREAKSEDLLRVARDCLVKDNSASLEHCTTAQTHADYSRLTGVSLLLSAVSKSTAHKMLHPVREGLVIDLPRVKALQYEQRTIDRKTENPQPLSWPQDCKHAPNDPLTAARFQDDFIDILPKPWTAVSLCLSDDGSELYIARYRSGQTPLILKLPFSRHKPDNVDEEAFDYYRGKAELQEIIDLSNYTCHNPGSLEAKGAKSKWWSEREALDRRMHELLINIENIWFGGFKAIFSQEKRQPGLLSRFRKSFDQILDRYLPSRKASKGRMEKLAYDDSVLELFIGLGSDQDGTVDLEEPLADLLYFVVDMLQFSGERNAYDEIDFDSMALDTLDALKAYHEACEDQDCQGKHLVLVLDRRLQAFPWESMPCLDGAGVSRVGSMLSLRERIIAMRGSRGQACGGDGKYFVRRTTGTYILNPSSDLAGTQTMLQPALSSLGKAEGAPWTAIVSREPTEDQFSSALKDSSVMLYFGHGAGTQYIRPRSIKRLEKCSEVVWLMGCSSGAVSEHGKLEPCAVPLAYLLAGEESAVADKNAEEDGGKCMAVISTLWDVTDKDIDRFSLTIGEQWGLWPASEQQKLPAKTPRKREVVAAPSTPEQFPKTPKTPKVRKTPAPTKTPARSKSRQRSKDGEKLSLVEAVARSRDSCYLRYLNGAAPVVYGVPVYLGD